MIKSIEIPVQKSNIMKAIVMLLIVLGHNHILAPNEGMFSLFGYLYSFHVSVFFILPFFYKKEDILNRENIGKIVVRNGIPYLLFSIFCYFVYHFVLVKDGFDLSKLWAGIVNAPGYNIKDTVGFVFLWFLPVFMLMSLCKLIGSRYKIWMIIFFLIGFIICVNREAYIFMWHSPFYLLKALHYYAMGMSTYLLYKYVKYINYIGIFVFVILTVLYWTNSYQANYFYFSISGFCVLKELVQRFDFSKISILSLIGKYSLPIYLMHVFIYNVLERVLPHSLLWGVIIYFITIGLSLFISIGIYKIELLRKFLFPRTWEEWKYLFAKS